MTNPCDMPCPKCGSADVYRQYYEKGQSVGTEKYGEPEFKDGVSGEGLRFWTIKALIRNTCRCCRFQWASAPLSKPKKSTTSAADNGGEKS